MKEPITSPKPFEEIDDSEATASAAGSASFKCDQCDRTFHTTKGLKVHIGRSHNPETEHKVLCDTVADNSMELHGIPEMNQSRDKIIPKVLHSSIGLDNDPKIKPPDS